jgi:peptidoglycan hydrolase CwlO-like protein
MSLSMMWEKELADLRTHVQYLHEQNDILKTVQEQQNQTILALQSEVANMNTAQENLQKKTGKQGIFILRFAQY